MIVQGKYDCPWEKHWYRREYAFLAPDDTKIGDWLIIVGKGGWPAMVQVTGLEPNHYEYRVRKAVGRYRQSTIHRATDVWYDQDGTKRHPKANKYGHITH